MITAFRARNLRGIEDSGWLKIKKLNVLVGKNSAGKSTLLRVLPLLRQSVERPTKGPILWFGRFVDFGSFQNAVNAQSPECGITFDFQLHLRGADKKHRAVADELLLGPAETAHFYKTLTRVQASLTMGLGADDSVGKPQSMHLNLGSDTVTVKFEGFGSVQALIINGRDIKLPLRRRWLTQAGKIFPTPIVLREATFDESGEKNSFWTIEQRPFSEMLINSLVGFFHGNTSRQRIAEFARTLFYADSNSFFKQLQAKSGISATFSSQIRTFDAGSPQVRDIREAVLLASLSGVFRRVDEEILQFAESVRYVEPLRATAERYYRQQDFAVDEIDSRGENAAMFLSSLQSWEMDHLKRWMLSNLGFFADVEQGSGHVQVKICYDDGRSQNIADLGFGYSQMLPIILLVWRSMAFPRRRRNLSRSILAIEQPELHLHPHFQAQIADIFAAVLKGTEVGSVVFLETHSEHIVNRLGQLIADGRLNENDVQILVVEDDGTKGAKVRQVTYDHKGFLDDQWPVGFFVPGSS